MAIERGQPQLVMARLGQDPLPALLPPAGCVVRPFRAGDEGHWEKVIASSFAVESFKFDRFMRSDAAFLEERIWFVECDGDVAATASAWRSSRFGSDVGYVHMVGVKPGHQGKQLGYLASLAVLHQFAREGLASAVLETDDDRLQAIKLYGRLGFRPLLVHENHAKRWAAALQTQIF